MKTKYFFGWDNIKWRIKELINIYSSKTSYFSKKRIESGIAFLIAQWGMVYFLYQHHQTLTMGEFLLWVAVEFAVSGYMINQIQNEKKEKMDSSSTENNSDVIL